jgi:hypothetical protein
MDRDDYFSGLEIYKNHESLTFSKRSRQLEVHLALGSEKRIKLAISDIAPKYPEKNLPAPDQLSFRSIFVPAFEA